MLMQNMDETLDVKPKVTIDGKQLELLHIAAASVGQEYEMKCTAVISAINQDKGADGIPRNSITFELSRIEMVEPKADLSGMYPNSPGAMK